MSSIKKPILLDETGVQLVDTIKEVLDESKLQTSALRTQAAMLSVISRGSMSNITSWRDIQALVRQGWAREVFHVGDQFVIKWTNQVTGQAYDIPLDVVHFGDVKLANGQIVPGMYLQSHYGTYLGETGLGLEFDAPEPNNNISSIRSGGHNNWAHSAVRKWLNSKADAGEWWSASTATDEEPANASALAGFMSGLENDFLSVIGPIQVTTGCWAQIGTDTVAWSNETTFDTFFLPSVEQIYGVPQNEGEGEAFEYWRNISGRTTPNPLGRANKNPAFITYALENSGKAVYVRLRSCERTSTRPEVTYIINNEGAITTLSAANNTTRFAPVCVVY